MEKNRETIEVLNDLIQINNDRIVGYEKAIRQTNVEDTDLKILYASMVAEGHRMKIALATEVQALGAEIENGTTASGRIYMAWMDVKAALSMDDRKAIFDSCEFGEDAAKKVYEEVLKTKAEDLTPKQYHFIIPK